MSGRQYGKLLTSIWRDDDYTQLDTDPQWLYEHLISQPNIDTAGIVPLQVTKWAKGAADMTVDRVKAAARVLTDARYIVVDFRTEEVLVRTYIRHDIATAGSPKVLKGALNCALRVQSRDLRAVLFSEIRRLDCAMSDDLQVLVDALEASVVLGTKKAQPHLPLQQQSQRSLSDGYRKPSESLSGKRCSDADQKPVEDRSKLPEAVRRELP
jgi:hypothetical protein